MKFRTEIEVPKSEYEITHSMQGLSVGSCFTSYIGLRLKYDKFPILVNPFGTVFNPISIANSLDLLTKTQKVTESDLIENAGVWTSFKLHGSFSSVSKQGVLQKYKKQLEEFQNLSKIDYTIITLGTSWVYEYVKTQELVSNCHKFPAKDFYRYRLSVEQVQTALNQIVLKLLGLNPRAKIIFTISPIRHWKDGAYENQLSKSTLFLAVDEVIKEHACAEYFPAYELVMDDLRDYRFYEQDMLHPNVQAISYIQDKFYATYFSDETKQLIESIREVSRGLNHIAFNPDSAEHKKFTEKLQAKINKLSCEHNITFEL